MIPKYLTMCDSEYCKQNWWKICSVSICALLICMSIGLLISGVNYNDGTLKLTGCIMLLVGVSIGIVLAVLFGDMTKCRSPNSTYSLV